MPEILRPYWQTSDRCSIRLYLGDVLEVLSRLPSRSVQMCVTSPPYWGLRSYLDNDHADKAHEIGSELTPNEYVAKMVEVFREVHRVLRDDGTLWLNLGDSYANGVGETGRTPGNLVGIPWRVALALQDDGWILRQDIIWAKKSPMPESIRNRCTKSHEYLFLFAKKSGYYYDAEAIKEKALRAGDHPGGDYSGPNSKNKDALASGGWLSKYQRLEGVPALRNKRSVWTISSESYSGKHFSVFPRKLVEPCILAGTSAHGACAKCGAPYKRITEQVVIYRDRPNDYVKRVPGSLTLMENPMDAPGGGGAHAVSRGVNSCANSIAGVEVKTLGWEPSCECYGKFVKRKSEVLGYGSYHGHELDGIEHGLRQSGKGPPGLKFQAPPTKIFERTVKEYTSSIPLDEHLIRPCVVLDPFIGSGTTALVAIAHGRRVIGIDLSDDYLQKQAIPRIEGDLLSRPGLEHLIAGLSGAVSYGDDVVDTES